MSLIRSLRVFCLLAVILTVQSAPAITLDWSKQTTAFIHKARRLAGEGDLAGARNAVSCAWCIYASEHTTPFTATGEQMTNEYLFPQGQSMSLFVWTNGTQLIYAEVRGDTFAVTWQAQLEQTNARTSGRNTGKAVEELPFVSAAGYGIVRELGRRPPADTPLVFFNYQPPVDLLIYGHINSSGVETSVNSLTMNQPEQYQTISVPGRQQTHRQAEAEAKAETKAAAEGKIEDNMGSFPVCVLKFVPSRPGSRYGHYIWKILKLPNIPGETASPGEVPPNKNGGRSSSAGAAGVPANTPSGSIGWTWASHPVTVGYVMRHTDAKRPAIIGTVHMEAGDLEENWRVEVFRMDSAGGVKCVVMDGKGRLVAVTLVMIGQFVKGNYGHRVGVRMFRTDVDRWPKEYVWGGGGAKRDGVAEGQTKHMVVLSRVLQFPGHLNLGVAEWP